jgi:glycosyltransferase involved in cell wall biosynthesis
MKKVIIAHVSKQHSFHTAIALERAGLLHQYITTVYDGPSSLTTRFKKFMKGDIKKKAGTRYCPEIPDSKVQQYGELYGLLRIALNRYFKVNIDLKVMDTFARKVKKNIIREKPDAVILFDGIHTQYLEEIKQKSPNTKIFMDVTIASRPYMKHLFEKDMEIFGHDKFLTEEKRLWDESLMKNVYEDFKYVDYFLVPSDVVERSMLYCNIEPERIIRLPYGVDLNRFSFKQKKNTGKPLQLLFVGNLSYRKGVHHLLNVVGSDEFKGKIKLKLAGGFDKEGDFYTQYANNENVDFLGFVTSDKIVQTFQESDFFILPSLAEGMALVILESLACGTPVIVSSNTGGNDAVADDGCGYVIPPSDREALRSVLLKVLNEREDISRLSEGTVACVKNYSWDSYYTGLAKIVNTKLQA